MFCAGFHLHSATGVSVSLKFIRFKLPQMIRKRTLFPVQSCFESSFHSLTGPPRCVHIRSLHSNTVYTRSWHRELVLPFSLRHSPNSSKRRPVLHFRQIVRNIETQPKQSSPNKEKVGISIWKRLVVVVVVGGLVWYCFQSVNKEKEINHEKLRYDEFKKVELGGDWVLTDQYGQQRSSTEFRGQWILLYFGFSHCPDICPEELEKLIQIVKVFDANPKMPNMLPLFITLDPERDTPAVLKDYLADLKYPRMLGFTGTVEEIGKVAKKFRAYFKKGPVDEDNDYIVDHTIIIYLINPRGEFVNFYDRSRTAERIVNSVTEHINKYVDLEKLGKL